VRQRAAAPTLFDPEAIFRTLEAHGVRYVLIKVHDTAVVVASLADVIRSKEAAGRGKDHLMLPTLRRLQERLDTRSRRRCVQ